MINYYDLVPIGILKDWQDCFGKEMLNSCITEDGKIVILFANGLKDRFHPICWLARINARNMSIVYNKKYAFKVSENA